MNNESTPDRGLKAEVHVLLEHLKEDGFRPKTDTSGDVYFMREGTRHYIEFVADDPYFIRLAIYQAPRESCEIETLQAAAWAATRTTKVAKLLLFEDMSSSAAVQGRYNALADFIEVLPQLIDALWYCENRFRERLNEPIDSVAQVVDKAKARSSCS